MTRTVLTVSSLFAITILAAGCASTPTANPEQTAAVVSDCRQLDAEMAKAEADKRKALAKEQGAWKAVVPFVVVGQYVSGKSAAQRADKQLETLYAEHTRQGCPRRGL